MCLVYQFGTMPVIKRLLFWFTIVSVVTGGPGEKLLYKDLLAQYDPLVRPVKNESESLVVTISLDMQQLMDIEEKAQIMVLNVWMKMVWRDVYLEWDPKSYHGVTEIRLPIASIWRPDVLLYNSADTQFDSMWPTNAVVFSTGEINWIPPGIMRSTCKINVEWFPFDDQHCKLKFGSWTFSGAQLDLRNGSVTNGTYVTNGEWKLMDVTSVRNDFKYDCCPEPYYDVTFTVWVRRRTLYYTMNLVVPATLISALTLLGFTLPPESGEKLALGVTIFMSLCVFLLMAAETLPQTSEAVPMISSYFSSVMVVVSASIVFTVMVLNFNHRMPDSHRMSPIIKQVFLEWLPWILWMERPGNPPVQPASPFSRSTTLPGGISGTFSKSLLANVLDCDDPQQLLRVDTSHPTSGHTDSKSYKMAATLIPSLHGSSSSDIALSEPGLSTIIHELRFITARMRNEDEEEQMKSDWRFAAMVVDRLCLVVFSVFLTFSTISMAYRAPHISA